MEDTWATLGTMSVGGGATLAGGIADANGVTKADLGVNFSF